jgi:hypothetical protein
MPDQKLTDLDEMLTVTDGDVFYVVDDPAGSPISKNISFSTMKSYFGGGGGCVTHVCGATGWRASANGSYDYGGRVLGGLTIMLATVEAGYTISGLVIGEWYCLESYGGPWNDGLGGTSYSFAVSNDGGSTWYGNQEPGGTPPPWGAHLEDHPDGNHCRLYFQATTTSIKARVDDTPGAFGDNSGSLWIYKLPAYIGVPLIHETAFQLSPGGNARGAYAVDFQKERWDDNDVAAADYSILLTSYRGEIHPSAEYCTAVGQGWDYFEVFGGNVPTNCHIIGDSNLIYGDSYGTFIIGEGGDTWDSYYCTTIGLSNQWIKNGYACVNITEDNDILENAYDGPMYSLSGCIGNDMIGDCQFCFQWGESNYMEGNGNGVGETNYNCVQFGFECYVGTAISHNMLMGYYAASYLPTRADYYDGRWVLADLPNSYSANQASKFSQNDLITTWPSSFTTSRFEFPIYQDLVWFFTAYIAGTESGCANSYAWKIEGVVENSNNTTTILTSTVTNFYRDVATKEWQVAADDANDRLVLQYRDTAGPDVTDCNIQLLLFTTEVGYYGI